MKPKQTDKQKRLPPLPQGDWLSPSPTPDGSVRDVTKSTLPRKEWHELAEDLLARFPGVDRGKLLEDMVAHYFCEMKYGTQREERAACDFLNHVQRYAVRQSERRTPNNHE
jgi:hypothetical protein